MKIFVWFGDDFCYVNAEKVALLSLKGLCICWNYELGNKASDGDIVKLAGWAKGSESLLNFITFY